MKVKADGKCILKSGQRLHLFSVPEWYDGLGKVVLFDISLFLLNLDTENHVWGVHGWKAFLYSIKLDNQGFVTLSNKCICNQEMKEPYFNIGTRIDSPVLFVTPIHSDAEVDVNMGTMKVLIIFIMPFAWCDEVCFIFVVACSWKKRTEQSNLMLLE